MKWLHVIPSIELGAGGTATIVRELAVAQIRLGDTSTVVSLDDCSEEAPEFSWIRLGKGYGVYGYSSKLSGWLECSIGDYERVVIHGLWQFPSWIARYWALRRGVPYWVFPHGMLDAWFKRTYPLKHFKKWIYWPFGEYPVLRDAEAVIYTSEAERIQSRKSFWLYQAREEVLPLGISSLLFSQETATNLFFERFPEVNGVRYWLFMGRIHPKKGLDLLLKALSLIDLPSDVRLLIAGPFFNLEYERSVRTMANESRWREKIIFLGPLEGAIKWGALYGAEVFVLTSHQENFGIAVVEALSVGCPVLISDQVNLQGEILEDHAGFVDADSVDGVVRLLNRWLHLSGNERLEMRGCARVSFENRYSIERCAQRLRKITDDRMMS